MTNQLFIPKIDGYQISSDLRRQNRWVLWYWEESLGRISNSPVRLDKFGPPRPIGIENSENWQSFAITYEQHLRSDGTYGMGFVGDHPARISNDTDSPNQGGRFLMECFPQI